MLFPIRMKPLISGLIAYFCFQVLAIAEDPTGEKSPNRNPAQQPFDPWAEAPQQQADTPKAPLATPSTEWTFHTTSNGSRPDGNEQQMMWLMNRARSNPEREGIWLADGLKQGNVLNAVRYFNVDLDILKSEFAAINEAPPAAFDSRLWEGSKDHSDDLIARDAQDHNGQFNKLSVYYTYNGGSASVFSYSKDAVHAHAGFNIDWGGNDGTGMQSGRGHRRALMDSNGSGLSNTGIAMIPDNNNSNSVGPLVTSIGYVRARTSVSNHYNRHIVGTIWTDTNGNDQYDPGEGHGGVSIMPDRGDFYTTTGDHGGFAIPATESGTYNLTISGGAIVQAEQRIVEVGSESVLMIWNQADTWDDPIDLVIPEAPPITVEVVEGQTRVSWQQQHGLDYQLRRSDNLVSWANDNRTILASGATRYFTLTQSDVDQRRFFDLLVTAE